MANVFGLQSFDASKPLAAYAQGLQNAQRVQKMRADEKQRNVLSGVGERLAAGDSAGAANTAFAGGQIDAGFAVQDRQQKALEKVREAMAGGAVNADTPAKWRAYIGSLSRAFPDDAAEITKYTDFGSRDALIGQFMTPAQQYQKRAQDRAYALDVAELNRKAAKDRADAGMGSDENFKREQGLRKEYTGRQEIKDFTDIVSGYEKVRAAAPINSGPGDIALVFGFMKIQDPGSAVREGEYATAENSAGVGQRVRNMYNSALKGVRLTPEQRAEFIRTADAVYRSQLGRVQGLNERYADIGRKYGVDPAAIVNPTPDFGPVDMPSNKGDRGDIVTLPDGSTATVRPN